MSKTKRYCCFAAGLVLALGLLIGLAESYLRYFPPRDLHPYLGEESPLVGTWKADEEFGAAYVNWEAFAESNRGRLQPYLPLLNPQADERVWAFFGNSFVHAPGMLGDHTIEAARDRVIFKLGLNEPVPIRFAQIKLLLEKGLKPERILLSFMPVDCMVLGRFPLKTIHVTHKGALTYEPHLPEGPAGEIVQHSRIAFTTWVRTENHQGNSNYSHKHRYGAVEPVLLDDLRQLFGNLARVAKKHDVPVTVLLIPEFYQVVRGQGFGFQDDLGKLLREQGFDVIDPRQVFLEHPHPRDLYVPDYHLSPEGNRLLLNALFSHWNYTPPVAIGSQG
jgi:hypothetical protein